jgi:hypothetical protein
MCYCCAAGAVYRSGNRENAYLFSHLLLLGCLLLPILSLLLTFDSIALSIIHNLCRKSASLFLRSGRTNLEGIRRCTARAHIDQYIFGAFILSFFLSFFLAISISVCMLDHGEQRGGRSIAEAAWVDCRGRLAFAADKTGRRSWPRRSRCWAVQNQTFLLRFFSAAAAECLYIAHGGGHAWW